MNTEKIILEPFRNSLSFSVSVLKSKSKYSEINYLICNKPLQKIIKHIIENINFNLQEEILFESNNIFDIRANEFNWSLKLSTNSDNFSQFILRSYLEDPKCIYLEIQYIKKTDKHTTQKKNIIYKHKKFKDILELEYHPLSFRQPDDNIRNWIIQFFQKEIELNHYKILFCIGGECTLFGKILSSIPKKYFITDFQSIYTDLIYNYPYNSEILLDSILQLDYKTCSIDWEKYQYIKDGFIIVNTGFQGLGKNLSQELINSRSNIIYIISCNETSFNKDFSILEHKYLINRIIEIKTNYSVYIYKLLLHL